MSWTTDRNNFKYDSATKGCTDYTYDDNGNLTIDNNKSISSITYNHLNLPSVIAVTGKGTITYIYDAAGNKQKKVTIENASAANNNIATTTTTTYIGGMVYESKTDNNPQTADYADVLQFGPHEEGRIRFKPVEGAIPASFAYDYFIKDHLGNVRMVLTDEQRTDAYPAASMETAQAATEEALYANLNTTRSDKPAGYPNDPYTNPNAKVARLKAATGNQKVGPSMVLKVMAGDKFNLRVSSWYKTNGTSPGTPINPLNDLLAMLINGVSGASAGKITGAELTTSGVLTPSVTDFLNTRSLTTGKPKAFVNWVLLDEQFKLVSTSSSAEQVGNNEEFKIHTKTNLPINKNGYIYVYVSNELRSTQRNQNKIIEIELNAQHRSVL